MSRYLGPLSSISGGVRTFYVDLQNQLDVLEKVTNINAIYPEHTGVTLSSGVILSSNVTTRDGYTLYSGEAVRFVASISGDYDFLTLITIDYNTNFGHGDSTVVYLKVQPRI